MTDPGLTQAFTVLPMLGNLRSRMRTAGVVFAAMSLALTATACSKSEPELPPLINDYVTGIQVLGEADASTEVVNKQLGEGSDDGPAAEVESAATVINGGSVQEAISAKDAFAKVRIGLEPLASNSPEPTGSPTARTTAANAPATGSGTPSKGYHEVTLKTAKTEVSVVLTIAQALPGQKFVFYFAIVDGSGKQGKLKQQAVEAVKVGTGDVQVSVSWDVDSDVDLHVVDPNGDEVYWNNTEVDSGGALDLDSNADCEIDHTNNENITWSKAPAGTYTVRVDYYRGCDVPRSNYVVTIQVVGQPTKTFTGFFTGEGDEGDEGAGKQIATFTVTGSATPTG